MHGIMHFTGIVHWNYALIKYCHFMHNSMHKSMELEWLTKTPIFHFVNEIMDRVCQKT